MSQKNSPSAIYLDYNATTPILPEVVKSMVEAMDSCHGNPSSLHRSGQSGRALLESSRDRILNRINGGRSGGQRGNLVFTSGGSESNRLAIMAALEVATGVRNTSQKINVLKFVAFSTSQISPDSFPNDLRRVNRNRRADLGCKNVYRASVLTC